MMILNNKDLKLALKDARENCPNKKIGDVLSKDNVMVADIFLGNKGIIKILKNALPLMESWDDSIGVHVKNTFKKYIELVDLKIN